MAFFRLAQRRRCSALTLDPNCTKLGFLGFCRPFHRNRALETGNTSISRLPQFCSLEQLLAFFRPAPRRRCPALTSGPNYTKLGFLCFCRPFHLNRALETGRHHYQQIGTVLAFFWRFFGCLKDDAFLHSPLARIAPNSVSWAFAGHFNGIGCWKRKNTSISRLPQFCSLEQLLAFFRPAPRRRCPALTSGLNCTKLGFLGFCRPFHRNRVLET